MFHDASSVLAILADASLKSLLLGLVTLVIVRIARLRDAAVLHRVWSLVVVGMLGLPLLTPVVPAIPALPSASAEWLAADNRAARQEAPSPAVAAIQPMPSVTAAAAEAFSEPAPSFDDPISVPATRPVAPPAPRRVEQTVPALSPRPSFSLGTTLVAVYASVAALLLGRILLGIFLAHRLVRRATPIDQGDLHDRIDYELTGGVAVVESPRVRVPVTTGLLRSTIVLPADWRDWSDDLVRMVLTHEREHARRRDVWFALASQLNTVVYWFHPVAWLVKRRLSDLAERVCDDAVLRVAGDRADYAESLVAMAGRLATAGSRIAAPLAVGMARRPQIEDRVEAVIDPQRRLSKRLTRLAACLLLGVAAPLLTLVSGLQPWKEAAAAATEQPKPTLTIRVVSEADGSPIADAVVRWNRSRSSLVQSLSTPWRDERVTGAQGEVTITPRRNELCSFKVYAAGYAEDAQTINVVGPTTVTSRLSPGVDLRGVVRDEQGVPLEDVTVSVHPSQRLDPQIGVIGTSNEGEYRFPYLPMKKLVLILSKPGYQGIHSEIDLRFASADKTRDLTLGLRPDGGSVIGVITNTDGEPIEGARIENSGGSTVIKKRLTSTDGQGRFRIDDVLRHYLGGYELNIRASSYVGRLIDFEPGSADDPTELKVVLEKGHRVRGRVIDESGASLSGVQVRYGAGFGHNTAGPTTDMNGRFQINSLPVNCKFDFSKKGYSEVRLKKLPLDSEKEHLITLLSLGVIRGRAVDAETGEPITPITVHVTFSPDRVEGDTLGSLSGSRVNGQGERFATPGGDFEMFDLIRGMPLQVTVRAEGYRRAVKRRVVVGKESDTRQDVYELTRIAPESLARVAGRVVGENGQPMPGIELRLIVAEERSEPRDRYPFTWNMIRHRSAHGKIAEVSEVRQFLSTATDEQGRFRFDGVEPGEDLEIAYWGEGLARGRLAGLEELSKEELADLTVETVAGGTVRGVIDREAYPNAASVSLWDKGDFSLDRPADTFDEEPDSESHAFEIRNVPAGDYELRVKGALRRSGPGFFSQVIKRVPVTVRSGEVLELTVGAETPAEPADEAEAGEKETPNATDAVEPGDEAEAGPEPKAEEPPAKPSISGRVVAGDTQQPVAGATVRLASWNAGATRYNNATETTDENGEFRFTEYGDGKLKIAAYHDNTASRTKMFGGLKVEPGDGGIRLELKPAPALKVRVASQEEGAPIEGARVRLTWTDGKRDHRTDARGEVTIPRLTAEVWTIEVHATGRAEDRQAISLPATGVTTVTSRLAPGAELRGVVRNQQGQPLEGVGVSVFPSDMRGPQIEWMKTNARGEYRFPYLPVEKVKLIVSKEGYRDIRPDFVLRSGPKPQVGDITLAKRPDGGSVTGVVTDSNGAPVEGARVANRGRSSADLREVFTDSKGRFRIDDVFRGSAGHELYVRAKGYVAEPVSFQPGSADDPAEVTVALEPGRSLRGRVVDEAGDPVAGVWVYYAEGNRFPGMDLGGRATTGPDGRFEFDSLPEDCPFSFSKRGYSKIRDKRLPIGGQKEVSVTLLSEGVILGKAVDAETGEPVTPFTVHITFSPDRTNDDPTPSITGNRATGLGDRFATPDGSFLMRELVRDAPLQVSIEAEGYRRAVKRRVLPGKESDARQNLFELIPIKPESLTRVAGRLVNESGQPVPGIELRLIVADRRPFPRDRFPFNWEMIQSRGGATGVEQVAQILQFLSATTDERGRFRFDRVQPGEDLEIAYWGEGVARDRRAKIELLTTEERVDLTIRTVAGGTVRGVIDREEYPEVSDVMLSGSNGFFREDAETDSHAFEIRNVPAGSYELQVYGPRKRAPSRLRSLGQNVDSRLGSFRRNVIKRVPITVRSGEVTELNVGAENAKRPVAKKPQPRQARRPEPAKASRNAANENAARVVTGRVLDESALPVVGARLLLAFNNYSNLGERRQVESVSDTDGEFALSVPAEWLKPGNHPQRYIVWCCHPEKRLTTTHAHAQLERGSTEPLRIVLDSATDTGFVVSDEAGKPIEGALVEPWHFLVGSYDIIPEAFRGAIGGVTDAQGRVRLPSIGRDGFFSVQVTADGYGVQQLRLRDSADEPAVRPITLRPTGRLVGRLKTSDRAAIESTKVYVYQEDFGGEHTHGEAEAEVDAEGRFEVAAFAEGPIRLIVRVDNDLEIRPRVPQSLEIYAGDETRVEIPFEPTVRVRGRVQTKEGRPAAGGLVSVSYGSFRQSEQVRTDADGRFEVNALAGEVRQQLIMKPRSFSDWAVEKAGWLNPITVPLQTESFDLPPIELIGTIPRPGTLTDRAGDPVAGAMVWALSGNRAYGHAMTKEDGSFDLRLPDSLEVEKYGVSADRQRRRPVVEVVSEAPLALRLRE